MPNFFEIINDNNTDVIHLLNSYILKLSEKTKRNVIIYYSGWLTAPNELQNGIVDMDKNGFMAMVNKLDVTKGLDLILHTPGGSVAATESIIYYLHEIFGNDIRAIVPQLAMSGGTMIACSCKEIIMGKQSNLGPIDPQLNGIPAQGVIEEFNRAKEEIKNDSSCIPLWQMIISKYDPTFLNSCQHSIEWSEEILKYSLENYMFNGKSDSKIIEKIITTLGSHKDTKAHDRHLSPKKCKDIGLNISMMENDNELQDLILSVHHCCMRIFLQLPAYKLFSNNLGNTLKFEYNIQK